MYSPRIVVWDLETRLGPESFPDGWDALRRGDSPISALCIWDSLDNWPHLYDEHTLGAAAAHLEAADVVVGHTTEHFDIPCLEGRLDRKLALREHIDLISSIWKALNLRDPFERQKGYKLNDLSLRTLGYGKSGDGANAVKLAAEGRYGELFDYCQRDVLLTRDLFNYVRREGGVIDANGRFLLLDLPSYLRNT